GRLGQGRGGLLSSRLIALGRLLLGTCRLGGGLGCLLHRLLGRGSLRRIAGRLVGHAGFTRMGLSHRNLLTLSLARLTFSRLSLTGFTGLGCFTLARFSGGRFA